MVTFLDRWIGFADRLSVVAVRLAGAMVLAAAVLVSADVLLRKLFGFSFGDVTELSGYAFAIATSWSLAFVLHNRANIRVDVFYARFSSPVRAILDLAALLSLLFFVGYLTWRASVVFEGSITLGARSRTPLQTPLWIPQFFWMLGLGLFLFSIVPVIARVSVALLSGDLSTVRRLASARSIDEEALDEGVQTDGTALDLAAEAKKCS